MNSNHLPKDEKGKNMTNYLKRFIQSNPIWSKLIFITLVGLLTIAFGLIRECLLRNYGVYTDATITDKIYSPKKSQRGTDNYKIFYKFSTINDDKHLYEAPQTVPISRYDDLNINDVIEVVYLPFSPYINDIRIPLSK